MNFSIELPKDSLLMTRTDLKDVIKETMTEVHKEMVSNEIMTIKETAGFLKVSVPTVRNLIANKEIPYFQRGQVIRLNRLDLMEWLKTISNK